MNIAFDARPLCDPQGEAFHYTWNLIESLATEAPDWRWQLFVDGGLPDGLFPTQQNVSVNRLFAPKRVWKLTALPAAAVESGADLIHVQGIPPITRRLPVVTTIRHLDPIHDPNRYPRVYAWSWRHLLPRQISDAAAVLVPWCAVKRQVETELSVSAPRLVVTRYGVAANCSPQPRQTVQEAAARLALPDSYVLGWPDPAEGPEPLVRRWHDAQHRGLGAELVICGESRNGFQALPELDPADRPAVISGAVACLVGGRSEFTALTSLTSLACGTPPVLAETPVLREVAGAMGIVGDDHRQAQGLVDLAREDAPRRGRWLQEGLSAARRYSWREAARQTLAVYRAVLAGETLPLSDFGCDSR